MKKRYSLSAIIIVAIIALSTWRLNRLPEHSPHYDAATCAAAALLGNKPASDKELQDKVHAIIANENNSYAVDQVKYDDELAQISVKRYQSMSPQQKEESDQNIDSCINVIANTDKTN